MMKARMTCPRTKPAITESASSMKSVTSDRRRLGYEAHEPGANALYIGHEEERQRKRQQHVDREGDRSAEYAEGSQTEARGKRTNNCACAREVSENKGSDLGREMLEERARRWVRCLPFE